MQCPPCSVDNQSHGQGGGTGTGRVRRNPSLQHVTPLTDLPPRLVRLTAFQLRSLSSIPVLALTKSVIPAAVDAVQTRALVPPPSNPPLRTRTRTRTRTPASTARKLCAQLLKHPQFVHMLSKPTHPCTVTDRLWSFSQGMICHLSGSMA